MRSFLLLVLAYFFAGGTPGKAGEPSSLPAPAAVRGGAIGYVLTGRDWAVYQNPSAAECPDGVNDGPREQFAKQFPENGGARSLLETQLMREADVWFPTRDVEPFPFKQAGGEISYGLDLDGKTDTRDFLSPDGARGIDNELYRAIGCIGSFRGPEGWIYQSGYADLHRVNHNRFMLEITGVDSLVDDDNVTVTSYRGLDYLLNDATGAGFLAGGTQHIDERWGAFAQSTWTGKIVNGVLTTEPADLIFPASASFATIALQKLKAYRFVLRLTPERAEGVMAGFVDVEQFVHHLNTSWSTHLQAYGRVSSASLYRALVGLADAYPDPITGEMTAISSAINVKFVQVYIAHPSPQTAGHLPPLPDAMRTGRGR